MIYFLFAQITYSLIFILPTLILAKLWKVRIEGISFFFAPIFPILKKKIKNTIFEIGWLPLGSSTKLSGVIIEGKENPQPFHFKSKPEWKQISLIYTPHYLTLLLSLFFYSKNLSLENIVLIFYPFIIYPILKAFFYLKKIKGVISSNFFILIYLSYLLCYSAPILFFIYSETPFFEQLKEIISGNITYSNFKPDMTNIYDIFAFLGMTSFFISIIPIGGSISLLAIESITEFKNKKFDQFIIFSIFINLICSFYLISKVLI